MDQKKPERDAAIAETIGKIRTLLDDGVDVPKIDAAKAELIALCARDDLFTFDAYPLPAPDSHERTYLIHCDADDRYALYVNAGTPGQTYRPHNHGVSWAIVAGVRGEETHHLYEETGDPTAPIDRKASLTVAPGKAVSLLPGGIHAIAAEGEEPLLHLHLYGTRLEEQGTRTEYDEATGETFSFKLEALGDIIDMR